MKQFMRRFAFLNSSQLVGRVTLLSEASRLMAIQYIQQQLMSTNLSDLPSSILRFASFRMKLEGEYTIPQNPNSPFKLVLAYPECEENDLAPIAISIRLQIPAPSSLAKYKADEAKESCFQGQTVFYTIINGQERQFVSLYLTKSVVLERDLMVFQPFCYVLVSKTPLTRLASQFLALIVREYHIPVEMQKITEFTGKLQSKANETRYRLEFLLNLIWNQPQDIIQIGSQLTLSISDPHRLSQPNHSLSYLLDKVSAQNIVALLSALILQRSPIIISNQPQNLGLLIHSLFSLLTPFNFTSFSLIFEDLQPSTQEIITAGFPCVVGVSSELWNSIFMKYYSDIDSFSIIFDLENGNFQLKDPSITLDAPFQDILIENLEVILQMEGEKRDTLVRQTIFMWFVSLLNDVGPYFNVTQTEFNSKEFKMSIEEIFDFEGYYNDQVELVGHPDFYDLLMKSQTFSSFIETHIQDEQTLYCQSIANFVKKGGMDKLIWHFEHLNLKLDAKHNYELKKLQQDWVYQVNLKHLSLPPTITIFNGNLVSVSSYPQIIPSPSLLTSKTKKSQKNLNIRISGMESSPSSSSNISAKKTKGGKVSLSIIKSNLVPSLTPKSAQMSSKQKLKSISPVNIPQIEVSQAVLGIPKDTGKLIDFSSLSTFCNLSRAQPVSRTGSVSTHEETKHTISQHSSGQIRPKCFSDSVQQLVPDKRQEKSSSTHDHSSTKSNKSGGHDSGSSKNGSMIKKRPPINSQQQKHPLAFSLLPSGGQHIIVKDSKQNKRTIVKREKIDLCPSMDIKRDRVHSEKAKEVGSFSKEEDKESPVSQAKSNFGMKKNVNYMVPVAQLDIDPETLKRNRSISYNTINSNIKGRFLSQTMRSDGDQKLSTGNNVGSVIPVQSCGDDDDGAMTYPNSD